MIPAIPASGIFRAAARSCGTPPCCPAATITTTPRPPQRRPARASPAARCRSATPCYAGTPSAGRLRRRRPRLSCQE